MRLRDHLPPPIGHSRYWLVLEEKAVPQVFPWCFLEQHRPEKIPEIFDSSRDGQIKTSRHLSGTIAKGHIKSSLLCSVLKYNLPNQREVYAENKKVQHVTLEKEKKARRLVTDESVEEN